MASMFTAFGVEARTTDKAILDAVASVFKAKKADQVLVTLGPKTTGEPLRWFVVWQPVDKAWDFERATTGLAKLFARLVAISDTGEAASGGTTFDAYQRKKLALSLGRQHVFVGKLAKKHRAGGRDSVTVGLAETDGGNRRGPERAADAKVAIDVVSRAKRPMTEDVVDAWSSLPPEWDGIVLDGNPDDPPIFEEDSKARPAKRAVAPATPAAPLVEARVARDSAYEAAIAKSLDDPAPYLAYATWLTANGDPRGELIRLQHAGKDDKAKTLLDAYKAHFLPSGTAASSWQWGFIEKLHVESNVVENVVGALAHPSALFPRTLVLRFRDPSALDVVLERIGERPLSSVRELVIYVHRPMMMMGAPSLYWGTQRTQRALARALPNLEHVKLVGSTIYLEGLDLGRLRSFKIATSDLRAHGSLATWMQGSPMLERLELYGLGYQTERKDLAPVLDATGFPKLVHLGLGCAAVSDAICDWLAESKLAAQLTALDLYGGSLSAVGAQRLAVSAERFGQLASLNIDENAVDEAGTAAVREAFAGRKKRVSDLKLEGQRRVGSGPSPVYPEWH